MSYHPIAEVDGRPVGAMQVCDPLVEPTHYGGTIEPTLRAIDIWIGAESDRNKGYGREMMHLAHERCFADPTVTAIVIDPLASNTRAIAFYQRLGYVTVRIKKSYVSFHLIPVYAIPALAQGPQPFD